MREDIAVSRRVVLHFPPSLADKPIMCRLAKDFDLEFNILKASITPKEEGLLVVELSGAAEDYEKGTKYLSEVGIVIQPLSQDVIRNETRCTHCGACVVLCPPGAFAIDAVTRRVKFDDSKCIACGVCVPACPPRAMEICF
ncbi:MAG TPA: (Fe-S)-binding protein [Dehalococcoidia bacterium]|nr:(Fe-S)-binding protein [Dehalococcoidia bacterium]